MAMKQDPVRWMEKTPSSGFSMWKMMVLVLVVGVTVGIGYLIFKSGGLPTSVVALRTSPTQSGVLPADSEAQPRASDARLSREGIDLVLNALDEAIRRKNVDDVLRHLAPDATITIRLKQGAQQQMAALTREEYRKTLAMAFAFPSTNDYTRTNTSVSLAADERSAKVSFKSTETLIQANREFKTEGEETLVFAVRNGKPTITSLEQTFPGDSI